MSVRQILSRVFEFFSIKLRRFGEKVLLLLLPRIRFEKLVPRESKNPSDNCLPPLAILLRQNHRPLRELFPRHNSSRRTDTTSDRVQKFSTAFAMNPIVSAIVRLNLDPFY